MRRDRWLLGALLSVFAATAVWSARVHSGVPDEVAVHIPAGVSFIESGRFAGGIGNPPLGQSWVGWPALLDGSYVLFEAEGLLGSRLAVVALALLGAGLLRRFARGLVGPLAALAAVFFLATSPTFSGHASLATLDVPITVAGLAAVAAARWVSRSGGKRAFTALGLALGAACSTKVQGLALLPLVALQIGAAVDPYWRRAHGARRSLVGASIVLASGLAVLHASYAFTPLRNGEWLPEAFLAATMAKALHGTSVGHQAYLAGEYSTSGWWSYFPIALAVKTPLVTLFCFTIGLASLVRSRERVVWLGLPIALFLGIGLVSSVNIGIRHVLPLYPFAFVVAGAGLVHLASRARILAIALVSVQVAEAWASAPHGIAYFNALGGGADGGYRLLLDSNYDWGQHDGALRAYLASDPSGVEVSIDPDPLVPRAGRILVGASALHGLLGSGPRAYTWLRERPSKRVAHTWFEYEVPVEAVPPVPPGPIARRLRPRRIALARHVLHATSHPAPAQSPKVAVDLAVACGAVLEYPCALEWLRGVLRQRPAHRGAFWLASELTASRRLGTLLFEGREYLDGQRPLEPAVAWLTPQQARVASLETGVATEIARLHRALAEWSFAANDPRDAAVHWRIARAVDPAHDPVQLAYRLGWLLATCAQPDCRAGAESVELAQFHGERRGWRGVAPYDLLAVALAASGRFEEAVEAGEQALARSRAGPQQAELGARLEGYRQRRAYRSTGPAGSAGEAR